MNKTLFGAGRRHTQMYCPRTMGIYGLSSTYYLYDRSFMFPSIYGWSSLGIDSSSSCFSLCGTGVERCHCRGQADDQNCYRYHERQTCRSTAVKGLLWFSRSIGLFFMNGIYRRPICLSTCTSHSPTSIVIESNATTLAGHWSGAQVNSD